MSVIGHPLPFPVADLEQATLDAVPPDRLVAVDEWLVGLDAGTVGRARSAVPLAHEAPPAGVVARIEALYGDAGLPAVFRLPADSPAFAATIADLEARGYRRSAATRVMTADIAAIVAALVDAGADGLAGRRDPLSGGPLVLDDVAREDWVAVFIGEGFDPVDGASRTRLLRRARSACYAGLRPPDGGDGFAAVGFATLSRGLLGLHGMRTRPAWRGRGFARRLIAALAARGRAAGIATAFLQVEAGNAGAIALYERLGFRMAWQYAYWERPAGSSTASSSG